MDAGVAVLADETPSAVQAATDEERARRRGRPSIRSRVWPVLELADAAYPRTGRDHGEAAAGIGRRFGGFCRKQRASIIRRGILVLA